MAFHPPETLDLLTALKMETAVHRKCNPLRALTLGVHKFYVANRPHLGSKLDVAGDRSCELYYNFLETLAHGTFSEIFRL